MHNLLADLQRLTPEDRKQKELQLLNSCPFFDIELSSLCNMNCVMCPRSQIKRKQDLMSLDLIRVLINWLPINAKAMLCGLGEPLLNANIFFLISALNKRGIEVGITTNGSLLTPNKIDQLLNCDISLIQVSFNGSTEVLYNNIMRGGSFPVVLKNLRYLAKVKTPQLSVKLAVTLQSSNINDLDNIKALANELGFEVFLRNCHSRGGTIQSNTSNTQINYPTGCGIFAKVTFIAANGDILSCCQDLKSKFVLGKLMQNTFQDILQRKKHVITKDRWFPICKCCDDEYRYFMLANEQI